MGFEKIKNKEAQIDLSNKKQKCILMFHSGFSNNINSNSIHSTLYGKFVTRMQGDPNQNFRFQIEIA